MSTRYSPNNQPWDDLPPNVQGAVKELHRQFENANTEYGDATRSLRDWWLSGCPSEWGDDYEQYARAFLEWCVRYPDIASHHRDLITQNTPATTIRAFFDTFVELMAKAVRRIFAHLIEIGSAHEADGIAWAREQAVKMIRDTLHWIAEWFHGTAYGDKLIEAFADEYVRRLESYVEEDAGNAYVALAKQPKPPVKTIGGSISKKQAQEDQAGDKADERKKIIGHVNDLSDNAAISYKDAALYFNCSVSTIKNWITDGHLKKDAKRGTVTVRSIRRWQRKRSVEKIRGNSD